MATLKTPGPETETPPPGAPAEAVLAAAPEVMADTLGQYVRASLLRIKSGDSGVLPVLVGLVVIAIIFQSQNSLFLSAGNLTNLLVQAAVFVLLGLAEIFALLLGEIDLSIGFVSGMAGVVTVELLASPRNWPWWAAVLAGIAVTAVIGAVQGTIITRLRLPSFVVTLAGLLGFQGLMIRIIGQGGIIPINNNVVNDLANGNLTVTAGWIVAIAGWLAYAAATWRRDRRRRASGLVAPPVSLTVLKIAGVAAAAVALLLVCNTNRGIVLPIRGVPWVVLIVIAMLVAWSVLLGRTRFGRYVYAIGGNAEAARRAGVNLARIRTAAFMLCSATAGVAGIVYASRLRSVSTNLDGGTLVLYAVAAAVIGGTSLLGGRGRPVHAVLGGIAIAAIANGMGLLGMAAATQLIVTALVLLAAVTIDSVARRGRAAVGTR
ncbi:MAG TPA: ABC transporter permease [Actinomycetota bacterium]|nr:ABC transporter permease [Actinomycetota bacterium]